MSTVSSQPSSSRAGSTTNGVSASIPWAPVSEIPKRRAAPRVIHRAPCRISVFADGATFECAGRTLNLSAGGLAVEAPHELPAGAAVEVSLSQPGGMPLTIAGNVTHARRVLSGTFEIGIVVAPAAASRPT
ncbi:MAG: PilZ domain-containing protein [Phycisphaerae bacterium]